MSRATAVHFMVYAVRPDDVLDLAAVIACGAEKPKRHSTHLREVTCRRCLGSQCALMDDFIVRDPRTEALP